MQEVTIDRSTAAVVPNKVMVTRADYRELMPLTAASRQQGDAADQLSEKLETCTLIDAVDIPPTVITMNTEAEVRDEATGHVTRLTLVYPRDANIATGRVSVLTPVGVALLGLAEGASVRFTAPSGEEKHMTVLKVLSQPEARSRELAPRRAAGSNHR